MCLKPVIVCIVQLASQGIRHYCERQGYAFYEIRVGDTYPRAKSERGQRLANRWLQSRAAVQMTRYVDIPGDVRLKARSGRVVII